MAKETKKEQRVPSSSSNTFDYEIGSPLRYPLRDPADHYIRFYVNLDEESKLIRESKVDVVGTVDQTDQNRIRSKPIDQDVFNVALGVGGAVKGATIGAAAAANKLRGFKGNIFKKALGATAGIATGAAIGGVAAYQLADQLKIDKKLKRLATQVTLYMPSVVSSSLGVNYEVTDDFISNLLTNGFDQETLDSVMNLEGSKLKSIAGSVARIIATGASPLIQSATRSAVNPKTDMLFKNIERRHFTFEFQFAPRDEAEAREVANIIHVFRLFSAPEVVENTLDLLYLYPAEFDIEFGMLKDGEEIENVNLIKVSSCVLKSVFVNYTPGGSFQTLANGEPLMTSMTLTFAELETLHRDRIAKGF